MVRRTNLSPFPQAAGAARAGGSAQIVQRAGAETVFAPTARVLRPPPPPHAVAEELVPAPGGGFQVRSVQRQTLSPPSGTFNFVRIHGETPRSQPLLVSSKLAHAQLAGGRPVIYAGTAQFERGEMAWWSNYSGSYQPIAAFRGQAGLPEDKFVPWQKLQMSGTAMQRGMFTERRAAVPEPAPTRSPARSADAPGDGGSAPVQKAGSPAGRTAGTASAAPVEKAGSGGSKP